MSLGGPKGHHGKKRILCRDPNSGILTASVVYPATNMSLFDFADHFGSTSYPTPPTRKCLVKRSMNSVKGIPDGEFIELRAKMYSLLYTENDKPVEKKVAKGIAKHITTRDIRNEHYKQCLFERRQFTTSMRQLRSYDHNIFSINLNKVGLSLFDNKL